MANKAKKESYTLYKTENRVEKNKILKLERHCKKYPEDKKCAERLKELKTKGGYVPRAKPLVPGSNPTTPTPKYHNPFIPRSRIKTPGEQLRELLGIKEPVVRKKVKTKVTTKRKRNVKS